MNPMLQLALILLLSTSVACRIRPGQSTSWCYYFNDPHLIPFASASGAQQSSYLCRNNCTEIMVKNEFLEIIVTPDPQVAYSIAEYTLIFFATAANPQPCVITNSIANPSTALLCQSGSPANNVYVSSTTQTYTHLTENIEVQIYQLGPWFNIVVTQSFDLIAQSTGVCVKWNCELEWGSGRKKRQHPPSDTVSQITDAFFNTALEESSTTIDSNLLSMLRTAVTYDISTTLDQRYAGIIAVTIAQEGAKAYRNQDDYGKYLAEADATVQQVICRAGEQANEIIAKSPEVYKNNERKLNYLRPIRYTSQCAGGRRKRDTSDARSFFH